MTKDTQEIFSLAEGLSVELKAELIDKLLYSVNPAQEEIDELWAVEAERRIDEVATGSVKTIPGEEVFRKVRERFGG